MSETPAPADAAAPDPPLDVRVLVAELAVLGAAHTDHERIDQLEDLERLKAAAAAAQARIADRMESDHALYEPGDSTTTRMRSLGAQIGLARHESPHRGRQALGLALAFRDLTHTYAALERGDINEHRAQIIASESSSLSRDDRRTLDHDIATQLAGLGDRKLQLLVQRHVLRIDEKGALLRRAAAHLRRAVTGRRLPDGMAMMTATVSDVDHAAITSSLQAHASTLLAAGDEDRTRGQIVADTFVERLTGSVSATATAVRIDLVVDAETLFGDQDSPGSSEPADIVGHGPIPASIARRLVAASPAQATRIRRLFRMPGTDRLVAMESSSRVFDGLLAEFIRIRDQVCRTPWCNAPVRHLDHLEPVAAGGPTSESNGQGLCEACNYVKETPGWAQWCASEPFDTHVVDIVTPTAHLHRSRSPGLLGLLGRRIRPGSKMEVYLADLVLIA